MSWRLALLFFALGIVTRLPFQTEHLWAHDSVLYERAIERFAPLEQRPQPPGYLYYVVLIRAVDALTGDANRAMTLVSLFADAAAVVGVVIWYAASAFADGGLAAFSEALRVQGQFVDERYSIFGTHGPRALSANAYELGRFLGRALYFLAPLLAAVPLSAAARHIELADRRRVLFVVAWTLTPLLIYLPIHSGEYGYVFSMLPGLCLIAARGAIALARGIRMPRTLPWVVGAVVLANGLIFLVSDTPLSATDIKRHDLGIIERYAYLQSAPDLDRATIIAAYD